jgi:hypothetical protein
LWLQLSTLPLKAYYYNCYYYYYYYCEKVFKVCRESSFIVLVQTAAQGVSDALKLNLLVLHVVIVILNVTALK